MVFMRRFRFSFFVLLSCLLVIFLQSKRGIALGDKENGIELFLQGLTFTQDIGLRNENGYVLGRPPLTLVSLAFKSKDTQILLEELKIEMDLDSRGKDLIPRQGGRMSPMHAERSADGKAVLYNVIHLEPISPGSTHISRLKGKARFTYVLSTNSYQSDLFTLDQGTKINMSGIGDGWQIGQVAREPRKVWTKERKFENYYLHFNLEFTGLSLQEKDTIESFNFLDSQENPVQFKLGKIKWSHGHGYYEVSVQEEHRKLRLNIDTLTGKSVQFPFFLEGLSVDKLGKKIINKSSGLDSGN